VVALKACLADFCGFLGSVSPFVWFDRRGLSAVATFRKGFDENIRYEKFVLPLNTINSMLVKG